MTMSFGASREARGTKRKRHEQPLPEAGGRSTLEPRAGELDALIGCIRSCRICRDAPLGAPLTHEPRPVVRVSSTARLLIAGQAPGVRVHASGLSFTDPSGERLRQWLGVTREEFYDESRVAIVPMGFCFPGHNAAKADLPPRRECREHWHDALFALLPQIETILAIGRYAQNYHLARLGLAHAKTAKLDELVAGWRALAAQQPRVIALPHPSWRNNAWLKRNPWFEADVVPMLQAHVRKALR